ncbi:hypothetical protein [Brachybacterium sp. UMB0905]|uniref:hypothetical protein n=1 Tax=Brachybacterium sp. UMB0905 TaxID=2069310 RepID=UPI000C802C36|nr:hypothetical protein [Brachybacterium sp. UMB0905]PMC76368.1 hypothetical protein CJ197_04225 [Brachybacterium sp. UMB0905]
MMIEVLDQRAVVRDKTLLASTMKRRGFSNASLADEVTFRLRRKARTAKERRDINVSRAQIGHLRNANMATRNTTSVEVADAIEESLDMPNGSLFATQVFSVSRYARQTA